MPERQPWAYPVPLGAPSSVRVNIQKFRARQASLGIIRHVCRLSLYIQSENAAVAAWPERPWTGGRGDGATTRGTAQRRAATRRRFRGDPAGRRRSAGR
ncbi:hypothetical protein CBM2606_A50018 [Cupriavidus taiwanensis]|nr:hypothetical protein CBM2606_A50018 [Cupriavidus taiwanensis]